MTKKSVRAPSTPFASAPSLSREDLARLEELLPRLLRYAMMICRDRPDAEALVQETLLDAQEMLHRFKKPRDRATLSAYLFMALKNNFIDKRRREKQETRSKHWSQPVELVEDHRDRRSQASVSIRPLAGAQPIVVTFYSAESGLGCSTAAVNIGRELSRRGRRVLLMDWDLAKPRVATLLQDTEPPSDVDRPGLTELLRSLATPIHLSWNNCLQRHRPTKGAPELHVLAANPNRGSHAREISNQDIDDLFDQHGLGRKLEALRSEWLANYDIILVDSPSGKSSFGGVCAINLPDVLVALCTTRSRSIKTTKSILRRAIAGHARQPVLFADALLSKIQPV